MEAVRPQVLRGLFGLQFRTTVLLTAVVLTATALTGMTFQHLSEQLVLSQTQRHASDLVKALAVAGARAVQRDDRDRLLAIAEDVISNENLVYVIFTDVSGHWMASHQRGTGTIDQLLLESTEQISVEPINHPRLVNSAAAGPHIDIVYPILAADDVPSPSVVRPIVGFVRLGVSLNSAGSQLTSITRQIIGLSVGIALLMVPLGYEIVRHLVKPLNRLSDAANALASGQHDIHVADNRRDEIGDLSRAFNAMAAKLSRTHRALMEQSEELEGRVRERTEALEQANRQLREVAARDSLTGLYNRRHFNDLLTQLFAESRRYRTDLTCMMLDLDNFKRVNDTLGHQTGDQLLQLTARAILESIRESDIAVRYGGDEFAILLPRTSPDDARASAERLLQRFRNDVIRALPEASIASLSIGLASRERDQPTTPAVLLQLADEALYLAKAGGKDRITVVRPVAIEQTA